MYKTLLTRSLVLAICVSYSALASAQQFNVLLFTKTDGYHHKSINDAVDAMEALAEKHHFNVDWHEDASRINTECHGACSPYVRKRPESIMTMADNDSLQSRP